MRTRVLLTLLGGFTLLNLLLLASVHALRLGTEPVDIQTRGLYEVRLAQLTEGQSVVVGDSLVFGGHLAATHGGGWPRFSLSGALESRMSVVPNRVPNRAPNRLPKVLNLGINGVLFRELACVVRDVLAQKPRALFINVSPRPFAADFAEDDPSTARPFVCSGSGLGEHIRQATRLLPVIGYRDTLQWRLFGTTPRAWARAQVSSAVTHLKAKPLPVQRQDDGEEDDEEEDDDAFVAQLLWRFRAAQRLNSVDVQAAHPQARALEELLSLLRTSGSTKVVVFYLHENEDALEGQLDRPRFQAQRTRFADLMRRGLTHAPGARFVELQAADFKGQYVDHVHLTGAGYAKLATRLVGVLNDLEQAGAAR